MQLKFDFKKGRKVTKCTHCNGVLEGLPTMETQGETFCSWDCYEFWKGEEWKRLRVFNVFSLN